MRLRASPPDWSRPTRASVRFPLFHTWVAGWLAAAAGFAATWAPAVGAAVEEGLRGIRADLVEETIGWSEQAALGLIAVWVAYLWLHWLFSRCRIEGRDVLLRTGVLTWTDRVVPTDGIRKLEVIRSPVGGLLDYGDVILDDGTSRPPVAWHLPAPESFVAAVRSLQEQRTIRG